MIIGVVIMLICFVNNSNVNGLEGLKELSNAGFGFFEEYGDKGFLDSPLITLISLILLTSMGVYGLPQTVHKYYTLRDKKAVTQGMIISTIFALIIGSIAYFVGGLSHLFFNSPSEFGNVTDNIIPIMLEIIPNGLIGIIGVLVLSASMSTLASVSLSSASVISVDLYKGFIDKEASDKKVTTSLRIVSFLFILLSVVIAILNKKYNITAIAYMMSLSWGTLSGCFFGPFVIGLYSRKLTKAGAISSMIGGLVFTIVLTIVFGIIKAPANASFGAILQTGVSLSPLTGVLCIIFSCLITIVVSCFTKKPSKEVIANAFDSKVENLI
jgi:SSS family solute:Na+ symporter/sodium/proline symporter